MPPCNEMGREIPLRKTGEKQGELAPLVIKRGESPLRKIGKKQGEFPPL